MTEPDPETTPGSSPGSDPEQPQARRRINPGQAPFRGLPMVQADDADGTIRVTRGHFDIDDLTREQRRLIQTMRGVDFLVFTNTFGGHQIAWRGQLVDSDVDLSRIADMPNRTDVAMALDWDVATYIEPYPDLEHVASALAARARHLTRLAEQYEQLVKDGWEFNDDRRTWPFGNIVQRRTDGISYAPAPPRTRRS